MLNTKKSFKCTIVFIFIQLLIAYTIMFLMDKYTNFNKMFIVNLLFYLLIFILPIFIYIGKFLRINPYAYLQLNEKKLKGLIIGFIISIFISLIYFVKNRFHINFCYDQTSIIVGLALASLFEEISFRGFYLKIFKDQLGFWKANLITSFLFAITHIQWLVKGDIIQIIMFFIIGIWLGYIFEKTKSLWTPIIVHMVYNILTIIT